MHILGIFELVPADEWTAIFYLVAVVAFGLSAFSAPALTKRVGGSVGLIGLGLGFYVFPTMWNAMKDAF
jgi:hypothetical protein